MELTEEQIAAIKNIDPNKLVALSEYIKNAPEKYSNAEGDEEEEIIPPPEEKNR